MDIAVLIPCYNEAESITKVIEDFKRELPAAKIFVFDNNSSDKTSNLAAAAGAEVVVVKRRGKGYVLQKMFKLVEADIYILVDGDDTYFAKDAHKLIAPIAEDEADMVIGRRMPVSPAAMKKMNKIGNVFFSGLLSLYFRRKLSDILSGYRAMSKEFVQNIPLLRYEFEVETEITAQALSKRMRVAETEVDYKDRAGGAASKLRLFKDGYMILMTMMALFRDLKPLSFFGSIAAGLWLAAGTYGAVVYYAQRIASLLDVIILTSLFIIGWLFFLIGFSLHTINRRFAELITVFKKIK